MTVEDKLEELFPEGWYIKMNRDNQKLLASTLRSLDYKTNWNLNGVTLSYGVNYKNSRKVITAFRSTGFTKCVEISLRWLLELIDNINNNKFEMYEIY